jgi:hypothetical protein
MQGKAEGVRDTILLGYKECQRAILRGQWKLIRYPQINKSQLFDLQSDPHEIADLAEKPEYAAKVKEMMALLEKAQKEVGDTCPLISEHPADAAWSPDKVKEEPAKPKKAKKKQG